ncbi:MAG: hypothetical protein R3A10_00415 [Caldilineaceae bacterium]
MRPPHPARAHEFDRQAEGAETIKLAWQPAAAARRLQAAGLLTGTGQWADLTTIGSAAPDGFDV